jgi:hypothetical protein
MAAYIEYKEGFPKNVDLAIAAIGFKELEVEVRTFTYEDLISGKFDKILHLHIFVGVVDTMNYIFNKLGKYPKQITFPKERTHFKFGLLGEVIEKFQLYKKPVFVKSVAIKGFDGVLIEKEMDLSFLKPHPKDTPVGYCDKIEMTSEFRIYIHNGQVVDFKNYSGDQKEYLNAGNWKDIEEQIKVNFDSGFPIAYSMDIALGPGLICIVEYNDFWALGNYGMEQQAYARCLKARYFEIINKGF